MLNVSQRFKELMKAPVKVVRARIEVEDGTVISAEDNLVSITLESQGQYFLSAARTGKATLLGTSWSSLQGKRLTIYLTAYANADEQDGEEACYGVYTVRLVEANLEKDMTNIEFDGSLTRATNTLYKTAVMVFPMTVAELATAVATQGNLNLITDMTTLPNYNYVITEDLWANINNATFRDVIDQIAGATATIARVGGAENNLEFVPVNQEPVDSLGYENLKKFKLGDEYGKVSSVVLARTPQEDNIVVVDEDTVDERKGENLYNPNVKYPEETVVELGNVQTTFGANGVMTLDGTMGTGNNIQFSGVRNDLVIPIESGKTYYAYVKYLSGSVDVGDLQLAYECMYNDGGSVYYRSHHLDGSNQLIQLDTSGTEYITRLRFYAYVGGGAQAPVFNNASIQVGIYERPVDDYIPYETNGIVEVKLANNEILDDDREILATPILNAVKGLGYRSVELDTEGHGWYEIGDKIDLYENDGKSLGTTVITYQKLEIAGSFRETLKCVLPEDTNTDYATAGSIYGSIWNTEIKVDKQGNEITSIVSRQDQFENETRENFTQVVQNIDSVVTTIQTTGGGNAIHNSVGYNKETDGTLVGWTSTGTVASETSPESLANGALSGNQIDLGVSSSITQRIAVDSSGSVYTLGFRAKKSVVGQAVVHLRNSLDDYTVVLPNGTGYLWEQLSIVAVRPSESYFDLVVETNNAVDYFAITDLMLTVGDSITPWVQATDEILSRNVALDSNGVKVSSNTSNDYVKLDELGLNGYSDAEGTMENVFTINRDMTEVSKLRARKQIEMPPLKVIPVNTSGNSGWAFVKIGDQQ